ncbi:hypothetical protein LEP1GSC115_5464 [Leptospira interrogans serovar Australis str. 200703203]|uniref:Uncharacterized protein n=1 Tax=Leptospira interrogans serovar Australis str. 200703203 TaxID=1085541 RepID=N1UJG4_LEPIR|nr:hypothetical protein LEP1GSC115_5464 [Leptospira interrogans serovar Australis str. 200703203]
MNQFSKNKISIILSVLGLIFLFYSSKNITVILVRWEKPFVMH